jgi:hypothetical protein
MPYIFVGLLMAFFAMFAADRFNDPWLIGGCGILFLIGSVYVILGVKDEVN